MKLSFFVAGLPKTSGSKRAFVPKGWTRAIVTEDCKGSKDWRGDVKTFALNAIEESTWPMGTTLPVRVRFSFTFPRPKSHFRTGKNAHLLRDDAPTCHTKIPDVLKLTRAVEDALTGIVWKDDAQICVELLTKEYGDKPGVEIVIETIDATAVARTNGEAAQIEKVL